MGGYFNWIIHEVLVFIEPQYSGMGFQGENSQMTPQIEANEKHHVHYKFVCKMKYYLSINEDQSIYCDLINVWRRVTISFAIQINAS